MTGLVVADLSALWAGPLAGRLLARAGARVIKIESASRPDGARRGDPRFHAAMNAGKESVAIELDRPTGREALARILARADVVITASRPRALDQLGLDPEDLVRTAPAPGLADDLGVRRPRVLRPGGVRRRRRRGRWTRGLGRLDALLLWRRRRRSADRPGRRRRRPLRPGERRGVDHPGVDGRRRRGGDRPRPLRRRARTLAPPVRSPPPPGPSPTSAPTSTAC